MTQRAILIVGEDEVLCCRCAKILRNWKTTTTDPAGAPLALLGRVWDLLILCETIEDYDAREIVSQAKGLYPDLRFFAISHGDSGRRLGIPTFEAMTFPPGKLRDAVAVLMSADSRQPSSTEFFPFAHFEAALGSVVTGSTEVLSPLVCRGRENLSPRLSLP
jgi:hypothetical protein